MKLSICMMVKNEEKNLDRCLSSLEVLRNEIDSELIIVDTGSTDNTIKIAQKYTDKVYFHKWNDDFSEMRNITISYAKGEWIFIIDADEELTEPEKLIELLTSKTIKNVKTIYIWCKSYMTYKVEETSVVIISPRLFRKNTIKYEGTVHNQPIFENPSGYIDVILNHYGYIINDKELMDKKFNRTVKLIKKVLDKEPDNVYYRHQLAKSYNMHGNKEEALIEITKAYKNIIDNKLSLDKYKYVVYEKASAETSLGNWNEVIDVCIKGIEAVNDYIDLYFLSAQALEKLDRYKESIYYYEKYLELLDNFNNLQIKLDSSIQFYTLNLREQAIFNLIILNQRINNEEKAIHYIMVLKDEKLLIDISANLILLALKNHEYCLIRKFYTEKIMNINENLKNLFYATLESNVLNVGIEEQKKVFRELCYYDNMYGELNSIRNLYFDNSSCLQEKIEQFIFKYNIGITSDFYGDIIYYMIKLKMKIDSTFSKHTEADIFKKLKYCADKYSDFATILSKEYNLEESNNMDFSLIRTNKIIAKTILLIHKNLSDKEYKSIFKHYINYGMLFVQSIYNKTVLDYKLVLDLKDSEEVFLLYMIKAFEQKENSNDEFSRYLIKALEIYPVMKRGVEFLLDELKNELETHNINNELENYKLQVKQTIKNLIETGDLANAEILINEYESIVKNDMEIVLFKSQISIRRLK